jgi:hypothetical protein
MVSASVRRAAAALLGCVVAGVAGGGTARAEEPARRSWAWADFAGAVDPVGLRLQVGWSVRRTIPDGEGLLRRGREVQAGVSVASTPSYGQLGAEFSAVPLAVLEVRARYRLTGFYGAYGALWRLPSRRAPFGDRELRDARGTPGLGQSLSGAVALRARFGRVIVRDELAAAFLLLSRDRGWYYLPEETLLVAPQDAILADQLVVLGELWKGEGDAALLAGPLVDYTRGVRADLTRVRAGALLRWTSAGRLGWLRRPSIGAAAGVYLRERNRRGQAFAGLVVGAELGGE